MLRKTCGTHSYREIGMYTPHLPQLLQHYRSQNFIGVSFSRDWQFGVYSRPREQGRWAGAFLVSISIIPGIFLLCVTCRCGRGTESLQQLGELCRSRAHWHSGACRVRFCERSTARSVITHIFYVLSGKHITRRLLFPSFASGMRWCLACRDKYSYKFGIWRLDGVGYVSCL